MICMYVRFSETSLLFLLILLNYVVAFLQGYLTSLNTVLCLINHLQEEGELSLI